MLDYLILPPKFTDLKGVLLSNKVCVYACHPSLSSVSWLGVIIGCLNTWWVTSVYLGWKLESYSFMHSLSWASRPIRAYPSLGQTTLMYFNLKTHFGHEHVAVDFSLGTPPTSEAISASNWMHILLWNLFYVIVLDSR